MREIQASQITEVVEKLCIEANYYLPEDVKMCDQKLPCLRGRRDRAGCAR